MAIAEVRSIWKSFNGRAVVQDVSFTIESGEILGMVGPNGAGKTTAIRILLDILQPDEGSVLLFGQPFAGEHRPVLGYLFFATLMAGLGAVASTAREGEQLSFMFIMPIVVSLSAWFYIVANPTVGIVRFLTLLPFTSPIVVMERLAVGVIEPLEIAASLGVLVLSVAGAMYLMARVFRTYLLMYGKRPGLREVARTLARAKV